MKITSRILYLSLSFALFSLTALGQSPGHGQHTEKFRKMKIAYFTENLDFTTKEAEVFWPLYNEFEKNRSELMTDRKIRSKEFVENADELSEQEAEKIIEEHFEIQNKELQLEIKFYNGLKKILPPKKVMKYYITEVQFREYMLRRLREERGDSNQKNKQELP